MLILESLCQEALEEALSYIHETWHPVAVIASGSTIRGNGDENSDFDLVVIHDQPWRQRVQKRFNGVPAELFVNPEFELVRTFTREASAGRPTMAHMISTGVVLHDTDGVTARLREKAEAVLAAGPTLSEEAMTVLRYGAATWFEDAVDIAESEPDQARMFLTLTPDRLVEMAFLREGKWSPRKKEQLVALEVQDTEAAKTVRAALNTVDVREAIALTMPLMERLVGTARFFEWTGAPQELTP